MDIVLIFLSLAILAALGVLLFKRNDRDQALLDKLSEQQLTQQKNALDHLVLLQDSLQKGRLESHQTLRDVMKDLTQSTTTTLHHISAQVDKRLNEGFEKTTATFLDIVKRLAMIDEAQKKMSELSNQVVNLQQILTDKKSRGTFGEVQLTSLIRNMLPESHVSFQHTFSNGKRADCVLFLPNPTGNIVIDSKFPLETYQRLQEPNLGELEKKTFEQQFRQDIKHHINAIAEKYILPNETADGAIMFIPAEAIFADIHAHYADLVEYSHEKRVWLTSPTTLMAVLTTARAVLKDDATRQQVHIIQEHLRMLAKDFERFQKRMDGLQKHIEQAHQDVNDVNTSAKKISTRFSRIERVELEDSVSIAVAPLPVSAMEEDTSL